MTAVALLVTIAIIIGLNVHSGLGWAFDLAITIVGGGIVACIGARITMGAIALLRRLPLVPTGILFGVFIGLCVGIPLSSALTFMTMILSTIVSIPLLVVAAFLGGAIEFGLKGGFRRPTAIVWFGLAVIFSVSTVFWLINPGQAEVTIAPAHPTHGESTLKGVSNPGLPGPFQVNGFFYGSGSDQRRKEYGAEVAVRTSSVDGSPFLHGWVELQGRLRTWYWGFGPEELPLNARVRYPQGDGPFPFVLIVHGNHRMFDYSDPGYAYLGEHLASHGFIAASIDHNFLKGSLYGELGGENAAGRWLLLQHLALWQTWNDSSDHLLAGKVE